MRRAAEDLSIVVPSPNALPVLRKGGREELGSRELRVEMRVMGYCGRDKSTVLGEKSATPGRIGHEGCGVIVELGAEVKDLSVGDKVIIFPFINKRNIGCDWPDEGKGVFATFPTIPAEAAFRIEKDSLSKEDWLALTLTEPFACALRGLKKGRAAECDCIVILGAGPMGCAHAILARHLNSKCKIILANSTPPRLELAKGRGIPADIFCSPSEVVDFTGSSKRLLIIHANSSKVSFKQAFQIATDNATILSFSGISGWNDSDTAELNLPISPKALHYEEYDESNIPHVDSNGKRIYLTGSVGCGRDDFEQAATWLLNKAITPLPLVTKILKFDEDILENLKREGSNKLNLKILMSPRPLVWNKNV